MNGNITEDGIAKDLAWMKRIGIGGVQTFDGSINTPQVVGKRLSYMSPDWKRAFRFATERADALGLELAVASSGGWSLTGGPTVAPEDAMKKLAWTETAVAGGRRYRGRLPQPSGAPGTFPGLRATEDEFSGRPAPADLYRDSVVVGYRMPAGAVLPAVQTILSNDAPLAGGAMLTDDDLATGVALPPGTNAKPGNVGLSYAKPQTVRSATVFVANLPAAGLTGPYEPRLEASTGGTTWRPVATFQLDAVPTTRSFAPVTARYFRLVFARGPRPDYSSIVPAPGIDFGAVAGAQGVGKREPTQLRQFSLSGEARVNAFEKKAGFAVATDYRALDEGVGPDETGTATSDVVDLTSRMAADGTLDWTPPAGRWRVLRMGWSLTGKTNHPASPEATGLEVDKYDADAVARYMTTYLGSYRQITGDTLFGQRGLQALLTDSIEAHASNWTPDMLRKFQARRGYDPRPWLPALTGAIIGSRARSDAFLSDFRQTLAELIASEHYGTVARVAHDNGLKVYGESLEGGRDTLGDDLAMRRYADVPMGALWYFAKQPSPGNVGDLKGAASIAHLYGRPYVAAESLTMIARPFAAAPADLKPVIDSIFAAGVNRPVLHTSIHQPLDKGPGIAMPAYGQYFTRLETWGEMARPWIDYIARTSLLLQQGKNVADVLYLYGEDTPVGLLASQRRLGDLPTGYGYDFVDAGTLLEGLSVRDGAIVSTGGARYRVLQLGGTADRMTLPVLRKLAALVEGGATVVGARPTELPSLENDGATFDAIAARLWGNGAETRVGAGRVLTGGVDAALVGRGVTRDVALEDGSAVPELTFVHRTLADGEIFFVSNQSAEARHLTLSFRSKGRAPAIWTAEDGTVQPASYRAAGDATLVPLHLEGKQSRLIVFREPITEPSRTVAAPVMTPVTQLDGTWAVAFQPGRGAPASTRLDRLAPLSEQGDAGIKYFSGVATYSKRLDAPRRVAGQRWWLDLGKVGEVAEVRVNGKLAGTAWAAPYRVELTGLLRPGGNTLEVKVANLWVNRLIGDLQPGATQIALTTVKTYTPKAPLRPSGLIGPVTLLSADASDPKR